MTEEKASNLPNWRERLEDAGQLPGEVLQNKSAVWEKLNSRMQDKPKAKVIAWYWLAAACLLILLFIPLLMNLHQTTVAVNPVNQNIKQSTSSLPLSTKKITPAPSVVSVSIKTKEKTTIIKPKNNNNTPALSQTKNTVALVVPITQNTVVPQLTDTASIAANTTPATIIPAKTSPKKLKVVHINELGEPVIEAPDDIAASYKHHSLQFKFLNREAYTNAVPSAHTNINIFKPRLASSN